MSSLTALTSLSALHIANGNYVSSNLQTSCTSGSHTLGEMGLYYVKYMNIKHDIALCSCLESLSLECCLFVILPQNTLFNTEIPHFESVRRLNLIQNIEDEMYNRYLGYYLNLEILICKGVDILDDDFVSETIRKGGFRNIVQFRVEATGDGALTMRTVELLMRHCTHLHTLGNLLCWPRLTADLVFNFLTSDSVKYRSSSITLVFTLTCFI
jgi:hypothetical protein